MHRFLDILPAALAERCRVLHGAPLRQSGHYVLYWMHHSMRAHDNPALEVAQALANEHGKALLVYQGLAGRHPYDSDRHHLFILQGARDVARECDAAGIEYQLFLPTEIDQPSPLPELLAHAAAAVFEQMPVPPFSRWYRRLTANADVPIVSVDARCIVPMTLSARAPTRAFAFRDTFKHEYSARIANTWPGYVATSPARASQHVFEPLAVADMTDTQLLDVIATLPIDHSVGPVADTRGGSQAGYARWQAFLADGMSRYHRLRNDAAQLEPPGVSRMSAYLHYGQVSPFRLANDAQRAGSAGSEKYLDELTIWRELAHHFCQHCDDPNALSALPDWALQSLTEHADDPRQQLLSLRSLQQAESGDALWDLCQRSLLVHGEMHNNLRMTWAKAIPHWTADPESALAALIDLNHRYALDGNDPASYGGLLWALGLFDRPFDPPQPVLGRVRSRSLRAHAKRLNTKLYEQHVRRSQGRALSIAVIGAGISGLAAAKTLAQHHHQVRVFEKSRGPGGRSATRRRDASVFDHGAQYFTVRDPRFRQHLQSWQRDGVLEQWPERVVRLDETGTQPANSRERWRGAGGMNALCKHLASGLSTQYQALVRRAAYADQQWQVEWQDADNSIHHESFDALVVSAPPEQTALLLGSGHPRFSAVAGSVASTPCWAVMLQTQKNSDAAAWQGAFVNSPAIAWIAARPAHESGQVNWVVHASTEWSVAHLEHDATVVANTLSKEFTRLTGLQPIPNSVVAHRWRYARTAKPLATHCLFDPDTVLGVCGDWCGASSRIEDAWLSGQSVAGSLLGHAVSEAPSPLPIQKNLFR
ncbi:MAG: FAD-dependent oxidoreductase [Pseudomonadota bacterium]